MKKTVLILPDGCEEGEALTIVDVLRRAEIDCKMCALENREVTGQCDQSRSGVKQSG